MSENFDKFLQEVETLKVEAEKFFVKQNKSAGTRLRKGLQVIRQLAKEIRQEVSDMKKQD